MHICLSVISLTSAIALLCLLFENVPLKRSFKDGCYRDLSFEVVAHYSKGLKEMPVFMVCQMLISTLILLVLDVFNFPDKETMRKLKSSISSTERSISPAITSLFSLYFPIVMHFLVCSTAFSLIIVNISSNPVFEKCDKSLYVDHYAITVFLDCLMYAVALTYMVRMVIYRRLRMH